MAQRRRKRINLLFTSAGRRVELLRAFQEAYKSLGLKGNIVAVDVDPLAPALQVASRPYVVPALSSPDYIPTMVRICRRERVNVVFPLIDPEIPVLARQREQIEATGARLAVVSLKAAETASDKWLTGQLFQRLALHTARSWLPGELNPAKAEYPLFIKPRIGSAAKDAFKAHDERELSFFLNYLPNPLIQEYLPGPEITTDVICDLDGGVLAVISRRRIEVRSGEVTKGVTIYDSRICDACVKIAKALPASSPITVQCMMKEGVPYFTEINARLGGGLPLGIEAGVDSPRWLLAKAAGLPVDIPPLGTYEVGLYMTRFDESFFATEAEREQMASNRL